MGREQLRRAVALARQTGTYGPTLWEVLPGLAAVVLGIALPLAGLLLLARWAGWW